MEWNKKKLNGMKMNAFNLITVWKVKEGIERNKDNSIWIWIKKEKRKM